MQAFDAAGRQPGAFLAQAVVDVAAMLQDGSLHASAQLVNRKGAWLTCVCFCCASGRPAAGSVAMLAVGHGSMIFQQQPTYQTDCVLPSLCSPASCTCLLMAHAALVCDVCSVGNPSH